MKKVEWQLQNYGLACPGSQQNKVGLKTVLLVLVREVGSWTFL